MPQRIRVVIGVSIALVAASLGFFWWSFGGLEGFQPPFEIVIPDTLRGVVCATTHPSTTEDIKHVVRHEVTADGLLEVDGDILRSHRPRKLFVRSQASAQLHEIPSSGLRSNFTENDLATGQWYSVMWLGTAEEWDAFRRSRGDKSFCLGRFYKVGNK
jgi:hypothetical protein